MATAGRTDAFGTVADSDQIAWCLVNHHTPFTGKDTPVSFLERALQSLPEAATSPLAFIAYIVTVAAWVWAVSRERQLRTLSKNIKEVPESQRPALVRQLLGDVIPASITASEWIQAKRQRYYFLAFLAAIFLILCLAGLSAWSARNQLNRIKDENLKNAAHIDQLQNQLGNAIKTNKTTVEGLADRLPEPPKPYFATVPAGAQGTAMRYMADPSTPGLGIWGISDGTTLAYGHSYYVVPGEAEAGFMVYDVMEGDRKDVHYSVAPESILHYRLTWYGERHPRFALVVGEKIIRIDRTGDGEVLGALVVEKDRLAPHKQFVSVYIDLPPEYWRLEMRDELRDVSR